MEAEFKDRILNTLDEQRFRINFSVERVNTYLINIALLVCRKCKHFLIRAYIHTKQTAIGVLPDYTVTRFKKLTLNSVL